MNMNKTNNYDVYIFKENDRINLVFDRYKLIDVLTSLFERIGVVNKINTPYQVTEKEKNIILSIIGENANIQYNYKDNNDKTIDHIYDLINATKLISSISSNFKTINSNKQDGDGSTSEPINTRINNRLYELTDKKPPNTETSLKEFFDTNLKSCDEDKATREVESFMDNDTKYCYLLNEISNEFDKNKKRSYYVLYNTVYEAVLICEKDYRIAQCVEEFKEFKLIREYDDLLDTTFNKIQEYFTKDIYCTEEMLVKKLDAFENLYDISQKCPLEKEKRLILYYINSNYHISNNVEKRIKVSLLQENVQKELRINDVNLKYRFASILSECGLQKKRYSDGMYIYGIEPKSEMKVVDKEEIRHLSINSIVEKRKKEIAELKLKKPEVTQQL
jgi:hypothetical protein